MIIYKILIVLCIKTSVCIVYRDQGLIYKPLENKNLIKELTNDELIKLFKNIPPIDYIVLFYIKLNNTCRYVVLSILHSLQYTRQFMNVYNLLSKEFNNENKSVKFVKFNCQGEYKSTDICHELNIKLVPTVVYISSFIIQRETIESKSFLRGIFRYIMKSFSKNDINIPNSTSYNGDLFIYEELKDWASLLYNISSLNRSLDDGRRNNKTKCTMKYLMYKILKYIASLNIIK